MSSSNASLRRRFFKCFLVNSASTPRDSNSLTKSSSIVIAKSSVEPNKAFLIFEPAFFANSTKLSSSFLNPPSPNPSIVGLGGFPPLLDEPAYLLGGGAGNCLPFELDDIGPCCNNSLTLLRLFDLHASINAS